MSFKSFVLVVLVVKPGQILIGSEMVLTFNSNFIF